MTLGERLFIAWTGTDGKRRVLQIDGIDF